MILKMFSVRDSKVGAFMSPFFLRSTGEGERAFSDLVNDEKSNIYRHPDDYALFELGSWDDQNAVFTPHEQPRSVGLAASFKTEALQAARSFQQ